MPCVPTSTTCGRATDLASRSGYVVSRTPKLDPSLVRLAGSEAHPSWQVQCRLAVPVRPERLAGQQQWPGCERGLGQVPAGREVHIG